MDSAHTLIISDVHLESKECHAQLLLDTLKNYDYKRLIIVGDLYEKGGQIGDEQFEVIKYLRENKKRVIYVDGNHDPAGKKLAKGILGIKAVRKHEWEIAGKKFCATHGHKFDRFFFVFSEPLIDKTISYILLLMQKIDTRKRFVGNWLDYFHARLSCHIARRAKRYARRHGLDVIICGHTHKQAHFTFFDRKNKKKIEYFNCGGWTNSVCSFISMDENGEMKIHLAGSKQ